ncbi:uncharacterized protein [Montipora foliosa]|uniref:uncharacterized protein isoform X1 n=1 Tax=Montipora foliosa TaxID=591990 RepID=UPI0035F20E88
MRLSLLLILFVLIAICAAKSSKSKSPKPTKTIKASETKKHKDQEQHKEAGKTHKTFSKQHDSKKKSKAHKTADKTSKVISDKAVNKTSGEKITNNTGNVDKKGNNTKAVLLQNTPADCQKIVEEYSNGKILMYEYKIQMGRCLKKAKEGDSADGADVKSDLLRPKADSETTDDDDSSQVVHVEPFNEENTPKKNDEDDDYERIPDTINHAEGLENDNDNENDFTDDNDDDEEDEPDEQADKKMMVPVNFGYQSYNVPVGLNMMPYQQQQGMLGQQAASFYPNMGQTPFNAAPAQSPAPVPQQSQAAFVPNPMNQYSTNPMALQPSRTNMAMNAEVKSNTPESSQPLAPASQANAVFDQWRASSFGATAADKKDQISAAPAIPANDEFADFMKMQSASSNSMEMNPESQQTAVQEATHQRSDIPRPQQQSMFPIQPQASNIVPGQGQAYYVQPEGVRYLPENPRDLQ